MNLLKEHKLYGKGMIEVNTKSMVSRYNRSLELLGLVPTSLKHFYIDGWGWSPEIADEKKDNYYLSHGLANPYAIILTPDQEEVSVFMPYHSFDKKMKNHVFKELAAQIHDLSLQTAIVMECDQDISRYRSPEDLLGIEYFSLRFSTVDNLTEAKEIQMQMERKFYDEKEAWADKEMRDKLRTSYHKYGVLADKKYLLPTIRFMDVDNFYTKAFDGLFVLRRLEGLPQTLLIYEKDTEKAEILSGQASNHMEFNLHDPRLIQYLMEKKIVVMNRDLLFGQIETIDRLKDIELANVLLQEEPDLDLYSLSAGQLKSKIVKYGDEKKLSDDYFEFEKLSSKLKKGQLVDLEKLPRRVLRKILIPNPKYATDDTRLIFRILLKIYPLDIFRLYLNDKEEFFNRFVEWSENKKKWAIDFIKPKYESLN